MPEADPVIIDDGGSTRIKHHREPHSPITGPVGEMDSLLDVGPTGSSHNFLGPTDGAFKKLKIVFVKPKGEPKEIPLAGIGALPQLATGDKVSIVSGNITLEVLIGASGASTLTVSGTGGSSPIVEAKQHRKRRRYVVSNAPPIDTVTFTRSGATPGAPDFNASTTESAYTMVHLTGAP